MDIEHILSIVLIQGVYDLIGKVVHAKNKRKVQFVLHGPICRLGHEHPV